jgi:hypothetical protein
MNLVRMVYSSQPFGFDDAILAGILMDARRCNARDGVTGALICRREVFLQMLEGPERQVHDTFARIGRDDRHMDVALHLSAPASARMFGNWAMLHDPARSVLLPPSGAIGEGIHRFTAEQVMGIFRQLAADAEHRAGR